MPDENLVLPEDGLLFLVLLCILWGDVDALRTRDESLVIHTLLASERTYVAAVKRHAAPKCSPFLSYTSASPLQMPIRCLY